MDLPARTTGLWEFILSYKYHFLFGLGCVVVFIIVAWAYQTLVEKFGDVGVNKWGWRGFNAIVIFVGSSISYSQKIENGGIMVPHVLITPVLIVLSLVLAKVMVGLISLPLTKGLLPNSVNQAGENKVAEKAADAKQYYDAMTNVLHRMVKDEVRDNLAVLRVHTQLEKEFIDEMLELMIYSFKSELEKWGLTAEFVAGTLDEMQTRDEVAAPDYATFAQISMAAKDRVQRYWDNGTAEPFVIWDNSYLLAMYSADVIPRNVLRAYVAAWVSLCELPYIKDLQLATIKANNIGVKTKEDIDKYLSQTS